VSELIQLTSKMRVKMMLAVRWMDWWESFNTLTKTTSWRKP